MIDCKHGLSVSVCVCVLPTSQLVTTGSTGPVAGASNFSISTIKSLKYKKERERKSQKFCSVSRCVCGEAIYKSAALQCYTLQLPLPLPFICLHFIIFSNRLASVYLCAFLWQRQFLGSEHTAVLQVFTLNLPIALSFNSDCTGDFPPGDSNGKTVTFSTTNLALSFCSFFYTSLCLSIPAGQWRRAIGAATSGQIGL